MSRIAGVFMREPGASPEEPLAALVDGAASSREWRRIARSIVPVGLAWTGWLDPAVAEADKAVAVVDGSFYNRADLGVSGENAAALLIALYRRHGFAEALRRINGEFAAALFDIERRTLWLGRDRFGVKPLYYSDEPKRLAFASRPR